MKVLVPLSNKRTDIHFCHAPLRSVVTALAVLGTCFVLDGTQCRAQHPYTGDEPGVQVLTRGPVHEAFAGIVSFDPQPGVTVPQAPPEAIEEWPPDARPEGANVTWIPGYWAWDDERDNFLWVSGVWRALPPGRQWVSGYWGQTRQGAQWISGYWADANVRQTAYLPPPPATMEAGPNIAPPSIGYIWTPGCWVWYHNRYAWRPGYWVYGRPDWVWYPAYYVWTPRGYVFVEGYWDYPVVHRGVLFAPVYFEQPVYVRRGYYYSPRIVINLNLFSEHSFVRPRYHHYYYGDYYAPAYVNRGFYFSFTYQSSHRGYDPIHAHRRWEHRQDRDWERRVQATYQNRRDHEDTRPPRTWAAQQNIQPATERDTSRVVAMPFQQVSREKDGPVRFQPVATQEKQQIIQREKEVQQFREQRRTLEVPPVQPPVATPAKALPPAKVELPRSPIVAQPPGILRRGATPPRAQKPPAPDLTVKARTAEPAPEPPDQHGHRPSPPSASQSRGRPVSPPPERGSPFRRDEMDNRGQREANTAITAPEKKDHPKKDKDQEDE
jgi:hypothetical protein